VSAVSFSLRRAGLIAQNTLLEAARQRLLQFFLLLALVLALGARWLRGFDFGSPELKFLSDCGFGAMAFFGAALVVVAAAQLFFSEIENRTVHTLLAKPVWRAEFVLGKFLGVAAIAAIFCAAMTLLIAVVLWTRESALVREMPEAFARGRSVPYAAVFLAGALQWLRLAVLGSLVLLVASYAGSQLFTVVTGFLLLVICQLQYLAHDAYARSSSAAARILGRLVVGALPNFQLFALVDPFSGTPAHAADVARVALYALAYIAAGCGLAAYCFRHREI
jgi:hypothetical protein